MFSLNLSVKVTINSIENRKFRPAFGNDEFEDMIDAPGEEEKEAPNTSEQLSSKSSFLLLVSLIWLLLYNRGLSLADAIVRNFGPN